MMISCPLMLMLVCWNWWHLGGFNKYHISSLSERWCLHCYFWSRRQVSCSFIFILLFIFYQPSQFLYGLYSFINCDIIVNTMHLPDDELASCHLLILFLKKIQFCRIIFIYLEILILYLFKCMPVLWRYGIHGTWKCRSPTRTLKQGPSLW